MNGLISPDELTVIRERLQADFELPVEERKKILDDRIDEILDILLMEYIYGNEDANEMLGLGVWWESTESSLGTEAYRIDTDRMDSTVNAEVAGETWKQRVREWYESDKGTADDIIRVLETESHRIYNDSILHVGEQAEADTGGVTKTWFTMLDEKVRSEHQYLEGMTVGINDYFYTYDGFRTQYPGGFGIPELDINCRCAIWITR